MAYYEKDWAKKWHAEVKINQKERTGEDYKILGRRFIEDYHKRHRPFDEGRVLTLERSIRFPLAEGSRYVCKGVIDRLMLAPDGVFEIHDYKTSSSLPEQAELDEDRQLGLYQIGVQTLWPEAKEVRLIWHYVAFNLEMSSRRTSEALDAEVKAVEGELDEIREAAITFAEKEGVQVIAGSEARLRVTGKERVICPAKGSEEREALEQELRAAGVWDEVSMLNASALERAVTEGRWAADVLDRIKAYISTEKRYTVTLKEDS